MKAQIDQKNSVLKIQLAKPVQILPKKKKHPQTNHYFRRATVISAPPLLSVLLKGIADHAADGTGLCQHYSSGRPSTSKIPCQGTTTPGSL